MHLRVYKKFSKKWHVSLKINLLSVHLAKVIDHIKTIIVLIQTVSKLKVLVHGCTF